MDVLALVGRNELPKRRDHRWRTSRLGGHVRIGEHDHHHTRQVGVDEVAHHRIVLLQIRQRRGHGNGVRQPFGHGRLGATLPVRLSQRERRQRARGVFVEAEFEREFTRSLKYAGIGHRGRRNEQVDVVLKGAERVGQMPVCIVLFAAVLVDTQQVAIDVDPRHL